MRQILAVAKIKVTGLNGSPQTSPMAMNLRLHAPCPTILPKNVTASLRALSPGKEVNTSTLLATKNRTEQQSSTSYGAS